MECVRVREEDLDLKIYHILADDIPRGENEISEIASVSPEKAGSSLQRLIAINLVEKTEAGYKALSIHEILLRCQVKYDQSCPFIIENGVIKAKSPPGPRDE